MRKTRFDLLRSCYFLQASGAEQCDAEGRRLPLNLLEELLFPNLPVSHCSVRRHGLYTIEVIYDD